MSLGMHDPLLIFLPGPLLSLIFVLLLVLLAARLTVPRRVALRHCFPRHGGCTALWVEAVRARVAAQQPASQATDVTFVFVLGTLAVALLLVAFRLFLPLLALTAFPGAQPQGPVVHRR